MTPATDAPTLTESVTPAPKETEPAAPRTPTTLIHPAGGKGGVGKTLVMVALTDALLSKKRKISLVDCDTENAGQPSSFSHWCNERQLNLNLRVSADRDRLLTESAGSGSDYVVVDFPSNASGDLSKWLRDVATEQTIRALGLQVITVCVVTPDPSSVHSAVKWISSLGNRSRYLVALNRIDYEAVDTPTEKLFADWFEVAVPKLVPAVVPAERIKTFEVGNLEAHRMQAMTRLGKLPGKALESTELNLLDRAAIRIWREGILASLEATGWFNHNGGPNDGATRAKTPKRAG
jgi:hypothetical protein